jgi:predicted MFS family arabinose efflux permease
MGCAVVKHLSHLCCATHRVGSASSLLNIFAVALGAMVGGVVADALSHNPVSLIGLMSFGTSVLLFMVAEELPLEAHKEGDHVWWVDLQLHVGFFASLMVGKFMPRE